MAQQWFYFSPFLAFCNLPLLPTFLILDWVKKIPHFWENWGKYIHKHCNPYLTYFATHSYLSKVQIVAKKIKIKDTSKGKVTFPQNCYAQGLWEEGKEASHASARWPPHQMLCEAAWTSEEHLSFTKQRRILKWGQVWCLDKFTSWWTGLELGEPLHQFCVLPFVLSWPLWLSPLICEREILKKKKSINLWQYLFPQTKWRTTINGTPSPPPHSPIQMDIRVSFS